MHSNICNCVECLWKCPAVINIIYSYTTNTLTLQEAKLIHLGYTCATCWSSWLNHTALILMSSLCTISPHCCALAHYSLRFFCWEKNFLLINTNCKFSLLDTSSSPNLLQYFAGVPGVTVFLQTYPDMRSIFVCVAVPALPACLTVIQLTCCWDITTGALCVSLSSDSRCLILCELLLSVQFQQCSREQ